MQEHPHSLIWHNSVKARALYHASHFLASSFKVKKPGLGILAENAILNTHRSAISDLRTIQTQPLFATILGNDLKVL